MSGVVRNMPLDPQCAGPEPSLGSDRHGSLFGT
jgi:hypothetical protein